jgi:hypothetical protein
MGWLLGVRRRGGQAELARGGKRQIVGGGRRLDHDHLAQRGHHAVGAGGE